MPNNFYSYIHILTNFVLSDNSIIPIPQTNVQKYLNKEINNYNLYVPNNVDYDYIEVKICTCRFSGGVYNYDPFVSIKIYDKVVNIPPLEVTNVSHRTNYYGGTTFNWVDPLDDDLEFVVFIMPWGAEYKINAGIETHESQYSQAQIQYVTIKTIDKSGNISNGIRYNLL